MRKIKFILLWIFLLCFFNNSFSQSKYSEIEKLLNFVGYVHDERIDKEEVNGQMLEKWYKIPNTKKFIPKLYAKTGTCFFIYTDTDFYLVTADHVAKSTTFNTKIIINSHDDKPLINNLKDLIFDKTKLNWVSHSHADVAVVQLDRGLIKNKIIDNFIDFEAINYKLEAPFREREVTIYGYPLGLGIGKNISPITKTSKPSSGLIELPRSDTNNLSTFFLLDDLSISGFSGGPVFELPQQIGSGKDALWVNVHRIVGLVHGSIADNKGGGFAAIVPSKYIYETIENAPGLSDTILIKYDNGNPWTKRDYKNGLPWHVYYNLKENGEEQDMGTLVNGNGTLNIYDSKGKLIFISTYKDGHLIEKKQIK